MLYRFRRAPIVITADISQKFLQVKLKKEECRYHRFLWHNLDQARPPDVYEFLRLPFGNAALPFCAQHVLHSHARSHVESYPTATDTVENSMYEDDILDSFKKQHEENTLQRDL